MQFNVRRRLGAKTFNSGLCDLLTDLFLALLPLQVSDSAMITDEAGPESAPIAQKVKTEYVLKFVKILCFCPSMMANPLLLLAILDSTLNWSLSTLRFGES